MKLRCLLTLICTIPILAFGQIQIAGVVTDETGEPMIGVSILEKGTSNGTITDLFGNYQLTVPQKSVLVFSYVGYNVKEISAQGKSKLDVTLDPSSTDLDEVVVIAY